MTVLTEADIARLTAGITEIHEAFNQLRRQTEQNNANQQRVLFAAIRELAVAMGVEVDALREADDK